MVILKLAPLIPIIKESESIALTSLSVLPGLHGAGAVIESRCHFIMDDIHVVDLGPVRTGGGQLEEPPTFRPSRHNDLLPHLPLLSSVGSGVVIVDVRLHRGMKFQIALVFGIASLTE
jgi:hypothetical protein